ESIIRAEECTHIDASWRCRQKRAAQALHRVIEHFMDLAESGQNDGVTELVVIAVEPGHARRTLYGGEARLPQPRGLLEECLPYFAASQQRDDVAIAILRAPESCDVEHAW